MQTQKVWILKVFIFPVFLYKVGLSPFENGAGNCP